MVNTQINFNYKIILKFQLKIKETKEGIIHISKF